MIIDRAKLEDYLARVAQSYSADEAHAVLMRFMCRCLKLVQQFLPRVGRNALNLATAYWIDRKGQAETLLEARVECWNYLDAKGGSSEIRDQEDAAMRAAICLLYAEPESDDFSLETVRWFADMFDRLGNYPDEIIQMMDV